MPHKACFPCNLLFEAAAVHVGVRVPCPNCGRPLEDYQVTEENPLDKPIGQATMAAGKDGEVSTRMFRLPAGSRGGRNTEPRARDDDDELFTSASGDLEEAPTRAIEARSLRANPSIDKRPPEKRPGRFDSEAPTRALDARKLAAGGEVDEDAPTRALDAQKLKQAVLVPAGPAPSGGVQGVSGPVPKKRARAPEPAEPPRRHRQPEPSPARLEPRPSLSRAEPPADIPRPPARPSPAPRPLARATPRAEEPAPVREAPSRRGAPPAKPAAKPAAKPDRAPRPAPKAAEPEVPAFFEDSRAMEVPDALGSLIDRERGGREASISTPPVARASRSVTPRPGRPLIFYILVAAALGLLAGAIVLVVTRDTDGPARTDGGAAAPKSEAQTEWRDKLTQALDRARVRLPDGTQGELIEDADFLVAGPEAVSTRKGPVVGLLSLPIPEDVVERDEGGEAVRPLLGALGQAETERLTIGLDRGESARTLARVLYSAWRAGYRRSGLLARRGSELITLEVAPYRPGTPLPAAGGLVLRVGQLALSAVVEGRDGRVVGDRPPPLSRNADGSVDFVALDQLLDELSSSHPRVRDAVVHVNGDLPLDLLIGVLGRVRGSEQRDRFPSISLAVQ